MLIIFVAGIQRSPLANGYDPSAFLLYSIDSDSRASCHLLDFVNYDSYNDILSRQSAQRIHLTSCKCVPQNYSVFCLGNHSDKIKVYGLWCLAPLSTILFQLYRGGRQNLNVSIFISISLLQNAFWLAAIIAGCI